MWGSSNELMVFPILELIDKEVRNAVQKYTTSPESSTGDILIQEASNNLIKYSGTLLTRLESNDYDLELKKEDPLNPQKLTGVKITFTDDLTQLINLNRNSAGKLSSVSIVIQLRESNSTAFSSNPLDMSKGDYLSYVRNKIAYVYYYGIFKSLDPAVTPEQKAEAEEQMDYYSSQNTQLRNLYGIIGDNLSMDELVSYLDNPLTLDRETFITYMKNKWLWVSEFPGITQDMKDGAAIQNQSIRTANLLSVDAYTYDDLKDSLFSPFPIYYDDYVKYVADKVELAALDENNPDNADRITVLTDDIRSILDSNYVVDDSTSVDELVRLLNIWKNTLDTGFTIKTLLRINISLNYSYEGKLMGVKSETIV